MIPKIQPERISFFLGDTEYRLKPEELRSALERTGLRIIGPAEAAVLEAMALVYGGLLREWGEKYQGPFSDACKAELARRQPPPEKERE